MTRSAPMLTCLIVDDNAIMRSIARKLVGRLGFQCSEAGDGAAALVMVQAAPPDLVLLDWEMPVLDGLDTLRALRAESWGRTSRIVMCTSHNAMDRIMAAIEAGADEYIMKPYDSDILADKLRAIGLLA